MLYSFLLFSRLDTVSEPHHPPFLSPRSILQLVTNTERLALKLNTEFKVWLCYPRRESILSKCTHIMLLIYIDFLPQFIRKIFKHTKMLKEFYN